MSLNPNLDWVGGAMNDGGKHARKDSLSNQKIITTVTGCLCSGALRRTVATGRCRHQQNLLVILRLDDKDEYNVYRAGRASKFGFQRKDVEG